MFQGMELFSPRSENKRVHPWKISYVSGNESPE